MNEKLELLRAVTRSIAFLIPLCSGCIGLFILPEVQDTLVGFVLGAATMAGTFYFKKSED